MAAIVYSKIREFAGGGIAFLPIETRDIFTCFCYVCWGELPQPTYAKTSLGSYTYRLPRNLQAFIIKRFNNSNALE